MRKLLLSYLRRFPFDHGKHKLANLIDLSKEGKQVTYTNRQGVTFHLDLEEYQMRQIFLFDFFEKNSVRHLLKLLDQNFRDGCTVLDVGTNIGFYTLTLAKALQGRNYQIHCFEPNPGTFELLEKNLEANGLPNIHLNQIGLGKEDSTFQLVFHTKNLGTANIYQSPAAKGGQTVEIQVRPLDDYCAEQGISGVQVIKVDIEGAELDFLKGASQTLAASPKLVMMMEIVEENCKRAGYTGAELFRYVKEAGFKAYIPKGWPFGLKPIEELPAHYHDNIIFLKGLNP